LHLEIFSGEKQNAFSTVMHTSKKGGSIHKRRDVNDDPYFVNQILVKLEENI